ncbi:MAG: group III truncated hemoglobin [Acidimicrobiia bacterium]|nr:group III truncated hemoglobin [Acidimicrobiia bacterium]
MPDLDTRTQIHDFIVGFYRAIIFDEVLEPVFDEVAEVDWAAHIPRLVDYWCRVLLGDPSYVGAMFAVHQHVHDIEAFRPEWFDRWHQLFVDTLVAGWSGPNAERAVAHAERNLGSMSRRLTGSDWTGSAPAERAPSTGVGADA